MSIFSGQTPTPHDLKEWLSNLPLANTGRSIEALSHKVLEIEACAYPALKQVTYLTQFLPLIQAFYEISENAIRLSAPHSLPLSYQDTRALEKLISQLIESYMQTVRAMQEEAHALPFVGEVIYNALWLCSKRLRLVYLNYETPPQDLWAHIHQLYLYAEKWALEEHLHTAQPQEPGSIAEMYKTLVLLGTAHTNELSPSEMIHLYQNLLFWNHYTHILRHKDQEKYITIPVDSDMPPQYRDMPIVEPFEAHSRLLSTQDLLAHLHRAIQQHEGESLTQQASLSLSALKKIYHGWFDFSTRKLHRQTKQYQVELCIGLVPTHQALSTWLNAQTLSRSSVTEKTIQLPDLTEATIIDTSPRGYGLEGDFNKTALHIGQLVGLYKQAYPLAYWRIGMVQWIHKLNARITRAGLILLGASVYPAALVMAQGNRTHPYPVLLLKENQEDKLFHAIVLPAFFTKHPEKMHIEIDQKIKTLHVGERLYSSQKYEVYTCEIE